MADTPAPTAPGPRTAPLNPAQQAVWLHDRLSGEPTLYREHACYELLGPLDEERLRSALHRAFDANPAFGAALRTTGGGLPELHLDQHTVEVQRRTVGEPDLPELLRRESLDGPTLDGGPLTRCLLLTVTPTRHVLLIVWHHVVGDGVALRSLLKSLQACWDDPGHRPPPGPTVCDANRAHLAAAAATAPRARAAAERLAHLPVQPLPRSTAAPGGSRCEVIDEQLGAVEGLGAAAAAARVTVPMLMTAAYQRAVGEVLGLEEFLLGCVTTGRSLPVSEDVGGCFVNTVLLRADGTPGADDRTLIRSSAYELVTAVREQDIPCGAIASRLLRGVRPRPQSFPQLYLSMDAPIPLHLAGLDCRRVRIHHAQAKFDVSLVVEHAPNGVQGALQYRDHVLTPDTARRLTRSFLTHLRALLAGLDRDTTRRAAAARTATR